MYRNFFDFNDEPFRTLPETDFFYCSDTHENAINILEYGISSRKGFLMLTGKPGTGKTTLVKILNDTLTDCDTAYVSAFSAKGQLINHISREYNIANGLNPGPEASLGLLIEFFVEKYKDGRNALIIVDDAENLTFEEFRFLKTLNEVEIEQCKLVQILLVGRPEFKKEKDHNAFEEDSEFFFSVELRPLNLKETSSYIYHRIKLVSDEFKDIFKKTALVELYRYSDGIPYMLNKMADSALAIAMEKKSSLVTSAHVLAAVKIVTENTPKPSKVNKPYFKYASIAAVALVLIIFFTSTQTGLNLLGIGDKDIPVDVVAVEKDKAPLESAKVEENKEAEKVVEVKTPDKTIPEVEPQYLEAEKQMAGIKRLSELEFDVQKIKIEDKEEPKSKFGDNAGILPLEDPVKKVEEDTKPAVEENVRYGCVATSKGLNLRSAPTTSGSVVTLALGGSSLKILGEEYSGKYLWYHVETGGYKGYMYSKFIKLVDSPDQCR